ncbi:MAG: tetratricopeptide repeat protein [Patescibacteria group bacterium]
MDFSQSFTTVNPLSGDGERKTVSNTIFDHLIQWGLRLTVLLVPLFFLTLTFEFFELNKQLLLLVLTVLMFVLWVAKAVFTKGTLLNRSVLNWLVLAWLAIVVLSTIFSVDPITSILGFYGRFNGGLVSTVAYALLFWLVINNVKGVEGVRKLLGWWLTSLGIASFLLILQLFGINILSFISTQAGLSLFGSSLNATLLLLATSLPLALWLSRDGKTLLARVGSLVVVGLIAVTLLLVDYQLGWLAAVVALVVWLIMVFIKNESVGFKWTMLPSLLLLVSVVAWPIATTAFTQVRVPVEVNLSTQASWKIALQNVKTSPILGSGPETFIFGFSKFKPENFNDSNFWAFRFDKAGSEFAQVLSTTGAVGFVVYVAIFLVALYLAWRMLKDKQASDWYLKAAILSSLLVMTVAQVFYFVNTSLSLAFWLILGLLALLAKTRERTVSLVSSPRASFIFSFGLALVILIALGVFYGAGTIWLADKAYAEGRANARSIDTLDTATERIQQAVNLNPWRDVYRISFAQVLLAQANRVASQSAATNEQERKNQIANLQNFIAASINQARAATDLGPENVANWEALGSIYRGTVLFARDAENWVIESFKQAIPKDPTNPALYTELGKAYLLSASRKLQEANQQGAEQERLKAEADSQIILAMEHFDKAIELKSNYTPAHFNQVLAYELQGNIDQAVDKLERMKEFNPQDIDVLFELGSLYRNKNEDDKALTAFTTITSLVPNHANTRFSLALIYEKKGEVDKAIAELEKVLETNPGNEQVLAKIDALKNQPVEEQEPEMPENQGENE